MLELLEAAIDEEVHLEAAAVLLAAEISMEMEIAISRKKIDEAGEDNYYEVLRNSTDECLDHIADIREEALSDVQDIANNRYLMSMCALLACPANCPAKTEWDWNFDSWEW